MLATLGRALAPFGLNLLGVTTPAAYDALAPAAHRLGAIDAGAIVVIGNGGAAFWEAYRAYVARRPEAAAAPHPVDAFSAEVLREHALTIAARAGGQPLLRLPFEEAGTRLSFVHLALAAGLGSRSLLGVLVHPEFGPWMALRGALLVAAAPPAPRPAAGFDPCSSCRERPCVAACPAAAVSVAAGWSAAACVDHRSAGERVGANPCPDCCHARVACVYGRRHRYPDDALAYHHDRAFAVMRAHAARSATRAPG